MHKYVLLMLLTVSALSQALGGGGASGDSVGGVSAAGSELAIKPEEFLFDGEPGRVAYKRDRHMITATVETRRGPARGSAQVSKLLKTGEYEIQAVEYLDSKIPRFNPLIYSRSGNLLVDIHPGTEAFLKIRINAFAAKHKLVGDKK